MATFDSATNSEYQKKMNAEVKAQIGEAISMATIGCYDSVYMLKAAAEKAQSMEPKDIAAAMPTIKVKIVLRSASATSKPTAPA